MRPPNMTTDEVILLVDTYFRLADKRNIRIDNEQIMELSNAMRKLPIHNELVKEETFRNTNGMKLKLYEIASMDKDVIINMNRGSNLQKLIYNYFKTRKELIGKIAKAMYSCLPLPFEYNKFDENITFLGGNILLQYHKFIEKKTDVALLMKNEMIKRATSICYICGNDLFEVYRESSYEILELHYAVEIYEMYRDMTVQSSKFISICPNCHCLAHSSIDLFEEYKLKHFVKSRSIRNV